MNRLAEQLPLPLSILFITLAALTVLSLSFWHAQQRPIAAQLRSAASQQQSTLNLAQALARQQSQMLGETHQLLQILGGISFAADQGSEACQAFLARQLENFPQYDNLAILGPERALRCHARLLPEPPSQVFWQGGAVEPGGLRLAIANGYLLASASPVSGWARPDTSTLAWLPLSSLFHLKGRHIPAATDLAWFDSRHNLLYAGPLGALSAAYTPADKEKLLNLPPEATLALTGSDGLGRLYSRQIVQNGNARITLIAGLPFSTQAPPLHTTWDSNAFIILAGALAATILLYFLARKSSVNRLPANVLLASIGNWFNKWLHPASAPSADGDSPTELRRDHEALKQAFTKHEERMRQLSCLDQFSLFVQSCSKHTEVAGAVAQFAQELFPHSTGALLLRASTDLFEPAVCWGGSQQLEAFQADDCWALRLGRIYHVRHPAAGACCAHLKQTPSEYLCLPLSAHGELLGVLHLSGHASRSSEQTPHSSDTAHWAAKALAERAALALSLIRREAVLRTQATRDALTGLYNRRFLEETLSIEERRAVRRTTSIGIMLLDVDHFKRFNDTFGHDAGDALLHGIGELLRDSVREGDMPCRLGGEEFVIVLPGADLHHTHLRAESLRQAIAAMVIEHNGQTLDKITASIGVACFPDHGASWQHVLKSADLALYEGKRNGRNRVMLAK